MCYIVSSYFMLKYKHLLKNKIKPQKKNYFIEDKLIN